MFCVFLQNTHTTLLLSDRPTQARTEKDWGTVEIEPTCPQQVYEGGGVGHKAVKAEPDTISGMGKQDFFQLTVNT